MRYLICFPQGGINDMFSRIQACIQYCILENRMLVLDTRKNWFRECWRDYFYINHKVLYHGEDVPSFITSLLKKNVYPKTLQDRTYESLPDAVWINPGHMEMDGIFVSTPLHISYTQDVVVYSDCGSSLHINHILSITVFSEEIKREYHRRRSVLPDKYISVHIRNTDYKSDIDTFIRMYDTTLKSNDLFVATDHHDSLIRMKERYGERVYSFASLPSLPEGTNIHESKVAQELRDTPEKRHDFLIDIFTDFLLLASGTECITSNSKSGFSRSVRELNKYPTLVYKLISS